MSLEIRPLSAAVGVALTVALTVSVLGELPSMLLPFAAALPLLVGIVVGVFPRLHSTSPRPTRAGLLLVMLCLTPALGIRTWLDLLAEDSLGWIAHGTLGPEIIRIGSRGRLSVALLIWGAGLSTQRSPALRPWGSALMWVGLGAALDALALWPAVLRAVGAVSDHHIWLSIFGVHAGALLFGAVAVYRQRRATQLLPVLAALLACWGGPAELARHAALTPSPDLPGLAPRLRFGAPSVDEALASAARPADDPAFWPCIAPRSTRPFPRKLRAGARLTLPADAPTSAVVEVVRDLRARSIFRLGIQGQPVPAPPPGLARDLLGAPVLELLLDRPPADTWWLRNGLPDQPVAVCGLAPPAAGALEAWVHELEAAQRAGCHALALAPSSRPEPEGCPAGG